VTDGEVEVHVPVVRVGDVDVVPGEHVVADGDRFVRDDPAPPSEEHPVTDREHDLAVEHVARRDPAGQRALGSDDDPAADAHVALAEERDGREQDGRVGAERPESPGPAAPRPDGTEPADALPEAEHHVSGPPGHVERVPGVGHGGAA
jgi:hypothetical protein